MDLYKLGTYMLLIPFVSLFIVGAISVLGVAILAAYEESKWLGHLSFGATVYVAIALILVMFGGKY